MASRQRQSRRVILIVALSVCVLIGNQAVAEEPGGAAPSFADQVLAHAASRVADIVTIEMPASDAQTLQSSAPAPRGMVAADVRERVNRAAPDETLDLVVRVKPVSMAPNMEKFERDTVMEIRGGKLLSTWVDGKAVEAEALEELLDEKRRLLSADAALRRDYYEDVWSELARNASDEELAAQMSKAEGGHSARHLALTSTQLAELERIGPHWLETIDLAPDANDIDAIADSMTTLGLTYGSNTSPNGFGTGIWIQDGSGRPTVTQPQIDQNRLYTQDYGSEPFENHATRMTAILMQTAAGASVHWAVAPLPCRIRGDVDTFAPTVYVSSTSSHPVADSTSDVFGACAADWDTFVRENQIAHFAATGISPGGGTPGVFTGANWVQGSAKARNVISVGATDDLSPPSFVSVISPWLDPNNGALKPEIVAPGLNVSVQNNTGSGFTNVQGTSPSAQLAAGLGAVLVEAYPALRHQPQLLKILLMTSARDTDNDGVSQLTGFSGADGAGIPRLEEAVDFNALLKASEGPNSSGASKEFSVWLSSSKTYKIGIAYLASGVYENAHAGQINVDYNMEIIDPSGTSLVHVASTGQVFRLIVMTPSVSGTYKVRANRSNNNDNSSFQLGFSVVEVL